MKKTLIALLMGMLCLQASHAQEIGSVVQDLQQRISRLQSKSWPGSEWSQQTVRADLARLSRGLDILHEQLRASQNALELKQIESEVASSAQYLKTSKALLPQAEATELGSILGETNSVLQTLQSMRLRFGGQASSAAHTLDSLDLANQKLRYRNVQHLLIDVRCARRLVSSLPTGRFPQFGVGFNTVNNLDSLQVRRIERAAWALERRLSAHGLDVSYSLNDWERFSREYNRMGYPGIGANVRQLERVMNRLESFYAQISPRS